MRLRSPSSLVLIASVGAASVAGAQARPPIRQLGPVVAASTESMINVMGLRHLPDGRVLVNDPLQRRVLLFDSTLKAFTTVIDSASGGENSYGPRFGGLIPYRGDSTLFVDPASLSMLMIDPGGRIARVLSVPRSEDASGLASASNGMPGFDAAGRLVYRPPTRFSMGGRPGGMVIGGSPSDARAAGMAAAASTSAADTAPLVRIDLATRKLDTIAWLKVQRPNMQITRGDDGSMSVRSVFNPLPVVDEWSVLADGSVAVVRGRDYHVDIIGADGAMRSAPKVPFEWQRLSDEDKVTLMDSVKAARERMMANAAATAAPGAAGAGGTRAVTPGGGAPGEQVVQTQMTIVGGGAGGPGGGTQTMRSSGPPQLSFVDPSELPDYKPPFFAGAARADAEGNLWVRTIPTKGIAGGFVYDVIDRKGALIDQVQVPVGRQIVGFGPGVAYLSARAGTGGMTIERARLR